MAALVGEAVMKIYVGCKLTYECIIRDLFSVNKSRIREISITYQSVNEYFKQFKYKNVFSLNL